MKSTINNLYCDARSNLKSMHVSKMTLSERIKYEKALVQLDAMKQIIDKYELAK